MKEYNIKNVIMKQLAEIDIVEEVEKLNKLENEVAPCGGRGLKRG